MTVTEDVNGELTAVYVMSGSVGRPVTAFPVVFPVEVAARLGTGDCSVPVPAEGGREVSAEVGTVGVVRAVGVWVDSGVEVSVWVMVGVEGTLTLCVVPAVMAEMTEETGDAEGELEPSGSGEFPVLKGTAVTLLMVCCV